MPKKTGTATEFILQVLASQADTEWRLADLRDRCDGRWTEANLYNTLTRLLVAGRIQKVVEGRAVWWSIGAAKAAPLTPTAVAAPAMVPAETATPGSPPEARAKVAAPMPDKTAETASQAILSLLGRHPDYEMQVNDVWEELGRKWAVQTVGNQLTWLAGAGQGWAAGLVEHQGLIGVTARASSAVTGRSAVAACASGRTRDLRGLRYPSQNSDREASCPQLPSGEASSPPPPPPPSFAPSR